MSYTRPFLTGLAVSITAGSLLVAGCGDDSAGTGDGGASGDAGPDAFHPPSDTTDPCHVAGYFFDGESDCNVVRCPELTCECPPPDGADAGAPSVSGETVTLSACVPGAGCLDRADCDRVCEPALRFDRQACEARMSAAGAQSCASDGDCVSGECREESVGSLCVDSVGCAEDGHCGAGSVCLFDPNSLDPETGFPTSLGACSDGSGGSHCYEDSQCVFGKCVGNRCAGGLEGESCEFNHNCASGFCRIVNPDDGAGNCVGGEHGDACIDDGDCGDGLHCAAGVCASGDVGQRCDDDEQCTGGICVSGLCRAGQLGSACSDDGDCENAFCVGSRCASGSLLAPCVDADDCQSGLFCARRLCSDGSTDYPCSTDDECASGECSGGTCT